MGFQQGLSGLKAASTSLDVIGNNISNASTVGFKQGTAHFSDIYSLSMHTAAANQVGIGVNVMRVQQQFTQGNVTPSANALDIAINGNGFFRFVDGDTDAVYYSRNGQLELTKDGYLTNGAGHRLTGYLANDVGQVLPGVPQVITLPTDYIDPKVTSRITSQLNLDSREAPATVAPFDPNNPLSFNDATSIDVYDSLGNMHVVQTYYVKTAPPAGANGNGTWDVYVYTDGTILNNDPATTGPDPIGTLEFDSYGRPVGPQDFPGLVIPGINGAATTAPPITMDYSGTTQYGSNFAVNDNQQDGYASGRLTGFSVDDFGNVMGRYSNGETKILAQISLVAFRNPNGLAPIGDNEWVETQASGAPIEGSPLTASLGSINDYSVEESNVDLTEELVDMIVAQRVYQANAQTIKTEDQIMQTLVNLR